MARTYLAFLKRDQIPDRTALQTSLKAIGFKLTIEDDYAPFSNAAYLPCTLDGEDAGLTLHIEADETIAGKDTAIKLKWGGDPREEATVLMFAAALAQDFEAVVLDPNNVEMKTDEVIARARKAFANLG